VALATVPRKEKHMGCDIHGFIEVGSQGEWVMYKNIKEYVNRNYDMFGLLFDVRNYCGYDPIAARRGLPADVSDETRESYGRTTDYHSASYITAQELAAIDWTKKSSQRNERTSIYRVVNGEERWEGSFGWSNVLTSAQHELLSYGETIVIGDLRYRRDYALYSDALEADWQRVIDDMSSLLATFDEVRLVVWFDN
jgi:hypothetical protein